MQYAIKLLWEMNEDLQPEIFSMFLISEGAGVGKGFVVRAITEYLRVLRYPNQNLSQSSVLVTTSTGVKQLLESMAQLYILSRAIFSENQVDSGNLQK